MSAIWYIYRWISTCDFSGKAGERTNKFHCFRKMIFMKSSNELHQLCDLSVDIIFGKLCTFKVQTIVWQKKNKHWKKKCSSEKEKKSHTILNVTLFRMQKKKCRIRRFISHWLQRGNYNEIIWWKMQSVCHWSWPLCRWMDGCEAVCSI